MRRKRAQPTAAEGERLLQELLETPTAEDIPLLRPVVLRSVTTQRREALGTRLRRTWFDYTLLVGEWGVALLFVVLLGYRIWDGPIYDWLYAPAAAQARPALVATAQTQTMPFVVPTSTAAHPDLGSALPSSDLAPAQPANVADYLVPAHSFVPAALPTAVPVAPVVEPAAPAAPPIDPRPSHITVPSIGLDQPVVEVVIQDNVWQVADYAVGYLHGTGIPGDGNVVMAGHKGVRGSVFAQLEGVKVGDDIFVDTAERHFHYRVRETGSVWPNQVSIMYPTVTPTLTMLTCTNWDLQRFVVVADLVESTPLVVQAGG